jgi:hypothetical protein
MRHLLNLLIYLKDLNQTKSELGTLQTNYKNLNRKLGQSISEKDAQIFQFQQSLACKFNFNFKKIKTSVLKYFLFLSKYMKKKSVY